MPDPHAPPPSLWECMRIHAGIPAEVVAELRGRLEAAHKPLGQVLLGQRLLTETQLTELLTAQIRHPHVRLGELAIRAGHCTEIDVDRALEIQRRTSPHPVQVILEARPVPAADLARGLARYVDVLEGLVRAQAQRLDELQPG